ncbi:cytochrome P450 [Sphingopyxis lindanitolerans]|uniref:cytochrome P450 n=1 Tax=Sphingopyxis lindanitolerans TaxID=2054227 RepID=UPI001304E252|nr:cytochrome P450 [Sphingopyxis lindanitolerans]
MPDILAPLPFMDAGFKSRSIDAVRHLAAAQGPLFKFALPFGGEAWLVANHGLSSGLLADPRLSKISPLRDAAEAGPHRLYRHLLVTDPPDHMRLRRQIRHALADWTSARIETLARAIIARRLATFDRDEASFDLVARIAMPAALEIACTIVGIPPRDMEKIHVWNDMLTRSDLDGEDRASEIAEEIERYLAALAETDAIGSGNGAIATLGRAASAGDLDNGEAMALAYLLLSAGYETTGHLLSSAVWLLVGDRKIWQTIAQDDAVAARAVEECLRFNPSLELATPRYAREDLDIAGTAVRKGDLLFIALGAANRDPAVFAAGSAFDCARSGPVHHLSFGRGPHVCPGAGIARVASRTILQELARHFPKLGLPAGHEPQWVPGLVMRGLRSLPVVIDGE